MDSAELEHLTQCMIAGEETALAELFSKYRERLKRIIRFRKDYRLGARVSDSDILQDTYISAAKRLNHFSEGQMPPFLWLRLMLGQQLVDLHRQHLAAEMRDVRKEVALDSGPGPQTSMAIAVQLVSQRSAASAQLERAEQIEQVEKLLNEMDPTDREVIALRHFEELTNVEAAAVLGIEPAAASKRYIRALKRLSKTVQSIEASQHD